MDVEFYDKGILRKKEIKRHIFFILDILQGFFFFRKKFDLYNIVYINTSVMVSAIVASFFSKNDVKIFCHIREIPENWMLPFFKILFYLSRTELIFNSQQTKKTFSLKGDVLWNGVSCSTIGLDLKKKSFDNKRIKILFIGRISLFKGQKFFLESLLRLDDRTLKQFSFQIVGSAIESNKNMEKELKEFVLFNKLSEYVEFVPFTKNTSLLFCKCDFVIVPSFLPEPFGRVAIEGFSYGKPVIAAKHGGLKEIVSHEKNGFFFSPQSQVELCDVLNRIAGLSSYEYRQISAEAYKNYKQYFTEDSYMENLQEIVSKNSN